MSDGVQRFSVERLAATPWKNGGGVTREIAVMPPGAGLDSFSWRVSIADVSADGAFSIFEGIDRVLILLDGNGVVLYDADGRIMHRLDTPFVPFAFSGDDRISSALIAGASTDFNVMTRRGLVNADVRVIRAPEELSAHDAGVLFVARGRWGAWSTSRDEAQLAAGDGLRWNGSTLGWQLTPESSDAVLIAVLLVR